MFEIDRFHGAQPYEHHLSGSLSPFIRVMAWHAVRSFPTCRLPEESDSFGQITAVASIPRNDGHQIFVILTWIAAKIGI